MSSVLPVPQNHNDFVTQFMETVNDGVHTARGDGSNTLEDILPVNSPKNALQIRYKMGRDHNLYLQAGMSLLYAKDERQLAPPHLYSADTLQATKVGLIAATTRSYEDDSKHAAEELKTIFVALRPLFKLDAVEAAVKTSGENLSVFLEKDDFNINTDMEAMQQLLKVFYKLIIDKDEFTKTVYDQYTKLPTGEEKPVPVENVTGDALEAGEESDREGKEGEEGEEGEEGYDSAATNAAWGRYASLHNLQFHRSPLSDAVHGMDDELQYQVPDHLAFQRALKTGAALIANQVPPPRKDVVATMADHATSHSAIVGAVVACDGNFTISDTKPLHPPKWDLAGKHCEEMALCASLEHAIAKCNRVCKTDGTIGVSSRRILKMAAARLKLKQLPHLIRLKNAVATGAPFSEPTPRTYNDENDFSRVLSGLVFRGLHFAFLKSDNDLKKLVSAALPSGSAEERRAGLWNEMLREIAISTDPLWSFVRTLSGLIGEPAESLITTADETSLRAAKQIEDRRKQIANQVATFQTKLVEIVMSSLLKDSKLSLSTSGSDAAKSMVVIDQDVARQIKDLASGESGRPFFEANVALRNLTETSKPRQLTDIIDGLHQIATGLRTSLTAELLPSADVAGATLAELSMPRNSFFLRLKEDTTAAIRLAYDRFLVEFNTQRGGRNIYLWELVEGSDSILSSRFAEFVGHILVANRTSTGTSAIYVSRAQVTTTAAKAFVSLGRLVNHASFYASRTPAPFSGSRTRDDYFKNNPGTNDVPPVWSSNTGTAQPNQMLLNKRVWVGGLNY